MSKYIGIEVSTGEELTFENIGVYTNAFKIEKEIVYTFQFKVINLNNSENLFITLTDGRNVKKISDIVVSEGVEINSFGDRKEYFHTVTFNNQISSGSIKIFIGRKKSKQDTINTPIFAIRETMLQVGEIATQWEDDYETSKEIIKNMSTNIEQNTEKIELSATKIEVSEQNDYLKGEISKLEIRSNRIEASVVEIEQTADEAYRKASELKIESDKIAAKVEVAGTNADAAYKKAATLEVTTNGIKTEVSSKVGKNEIVSSINQSAESIKIRANKIQLDGFVQFDDLGRYGTTTIDGSRIQTGTITGIGIEGCHLRGTQTLYMTPSSTLSADGDSNHKYFYVMRGGSFSVEPEGWFSNNIHVSGKVYAGDYQCVRSGGSALYLIDRLQVQSSSTNYLQVVTTSGTVMGINVDFSDRKLKENIELIDRQKSFLDLDRKKIGLEAIKDIKHYKYNFIGNENRVECGYIAQELQEDFTYDVEQEDGTVLKHLTLSSIVANTTLAIQQQQDIIEDLQMENKQLRKEIEEIKKKLSL